MLFPGEMTMPYTNPNPSSIQKLHAGQLDSIMDVVVNNQKMIYLLAPEIATRHEVASSNQPTSNMHGPIPQEEQPRLSGVLAKVPVCGDPGTCMDDFSGVPIDLSESPMNRFQAIRLELVDEKGNDLELRGFTFHGTISLKCSNF
jgi:hypothetical protein